jgi:hypothetical protein
MVEVPWLVILFGGLVVLSLITVVVVYLVTRAGDGEG